VSCSGMEEDWIIAALLREFMSFMQSYTIPTAATKKSKKHFW